MSEEDIEKLNTLKFFEMNGKKISLKEINQMYNNLEQENKNLKEIEKEHQRINGELREENQKLTNIIEELEKQLQEEE